MINHLINVLSTYQTVSIVFISTFLTIICLASKKSLKNSQSPSPTFNILPNDTIYDNDIEVISLGKSQKSKIPIRKNQINSISNPKNKGSTNNIITEKNDSLKRKPMSDEDIIATKTSNKNINNSFNSSFNNNKSFITSPLNNSTPINNNSTNSSNNNNTIKSTPTTIFNTSSSSRQSEIDESKKKTNTIKMLNQKKLEKEKIDEIENIESESQPSSIQNKPKQIRPFFVTSFPARQPIKPLNTTQPTPVSPQIVVKANNNRFNTIIALDGTIQEMPQKKEEKVETIPVSTPKINAKTVNNIIVNDIPNTAVTATATATSNTNTTTTAATTASNNNPNTISKNSGQKLVSKIKKSNLKGSEKDKYKILHNENNNQISKKSKKAVKFHNKVEVWARTPTFLYSEKPFFGISKEPEYYDFGDVNNIKEPNRFVVASNEPNSYSSKLRTRITNSSTDTQTTKRVSSFPVKKFYGTPRPLQQALFETPLSPVQTDGKQKQIQTTFRRQPVVKQISSAPIK